MLPVLQKKNHMIPADHRMNLMREKEDDQSAGANLVP